MLWSLGWHWGCSSQSHATHRFRWSKSANSRPRAAPSVSNTEIHHFLDRASLGQGQTLRMITKNMRLRISASSLCIFGTRKNTTALIVLPMNWPCASFYVCLFSKDDSLRFCWKDFAPFANLSDRMTMRRLSPSGEAWLFYSIEKALGCCGSRFLCCYQRSLTGAELFCVCPWRDFVSDTEICRRGVYFWPYTD
jgi:hypothetical protein